MRRRLRSIETVLDRGLPIAAALRSSLSEGYDRKAFQADLMAGLVVAIVALPLSMALAIAVGVPPEHGLYTAIIAGIAVSLFGGSRFQVTGPTAAFVVVLAPIAGRLGVGGLLTAGLLAGIMLLVMGVMRMGRLIEFIPHPVTTGFTSGIATVIFVLQVRDVLGLEVSKMPDEFPEKVHALWGARATASISDFLVAAATFILLLVIPKLTRKIPAPLIAITLVAAAVAAVRWFFPELEIATIGSRFRSVVDGKIVVGIPQELPTPRLPWGEQGLNLQYIRELLPASFAIAVLGAIESLLSAVIADGMTGRRHDPNAELVGLGIGNILAPFFGGIAATGALARTATNVRAGAVSPFAATLHSLMILLAILIAAPLVAYVPMASLAALLVIVAYNMADIHHFTHIVRVAPRSDVVVLVACYFLTVIFDMVIAVMAGVIFAALLFMKRMAELTSGRVLQTTDTEQQYKDLPERVALYEIAGPLFFGAANQAMVQLDALRANVRVVVFDVSKVPVIDATGLVALESALERLQRDRRFVILSGPLPMPKRVFDKAHLEQHHKNLIVVGSVQEALDMAQDLVLLSPEWALQSTRAPQAQPAAPASQANPQ